MKFTFRLGASFVLGTVLTMTRPGYSQISSSGSPQPPMRATPSAAKAGPQACARDLLKGFTYLKSEGDTDLYQHPKLTFSVRCRAKDVSFGELISEARKHGKIQMLGTRAYYLQTATSGAMVRSYVVDSKSYLLLTLVGPESNRKDLDVVEKELQRWIADHSD